MLRGGRGKGDSVLSIRRSWIFEEWKGILTTPCNAMNKIRGWTRVRSR
jgi:hypothetical protein